MACSITSHFSSLPDPRNPRGKLHNLADIVIIAILAFICGADDWTEVAVFARSKRSWLRTFLSLPNGIPSHDTFGRVFSMLCPKAFEACFTAWSRTLCQQTAGKLVAIDGKSVRRSFQHAWDRNGCVHLVSAYVAENHAVFGQIAVEHKRNELAAIHQLIELLDLRGATVTIDAIGCQREVARKLIDRQADYLLCVKQNQPTLHERIERFVREMDLSGWAGVPHATARTTDGGHGRIETRTLWCTDDIGWLDPEKQWPGLRSLVVCRCRRDPDLGEPSVQTRFYISSLGTLDAPGLLAKVRGHWSIENQLHWQLDVSFGEDQGRARKGHSAENQSRLRRLALMRLKQDQQYKVGIKAKRKAAGWDHDFLLSLAMGSTGDPA